MFIVFSHSVNGRVANDECDQFIIDWCEQFQRMFGDGFEIADDRLDDSNC